MRFGARTRSAAGRIPFGFRTLTAPGGASFRLNATPDTGVPPQSRTRDRGARTLPIPPGASEPPRQSQRSARHARAPALGSRLSALGSRLSALGSRLSALGSRLSMIQARISGNVKTLAEPSTMPPKGPRFFHPQLPFHVHPLAGTAPLGGHLVVPQQLTGRLPPSWTVRRFAPKPVSCEFFKHGENLIRRAQAAARQMTGGKGK